jgi:hypothetical protein
MACPFLGALLEISGVPAILSILAVFLMGLPNGIKKLTIPQEILIFYFFMVMVASCQWLIHCLMYALNGDIISMVMLIWIVVDVALGVKKNKTQEK